MTQKITALILTFNEEMHIERCINSLLGTVERICIVDSFSSDGTVEIARKLGAEVIQNPWKNYSTQFQFGLDHFDISSPWTLRIDADEYLEPDLLEGIEKWFSSEDPKVNALYLRRKIVFLDRPIRHGFFYPAFMLRIWRTGQGKIEERWMDEHIVVQNPVSHTLDGDLVDHNLNDLSWWIAKHNGYATREVYDMVEILENKNDAQKSMTGQAGRKRFIKEKIYSRVPATLRATFYFIYRYFFGFGFLDGKAGFFFHFLQAYWYRTLVEAKLYELQIRAEKQGLSPFQLLEKEGIFTKLPSEN